MSTSTPNMSEMCYNIYLFNLIYKIHWGEINQHFKVTTLKQTSQIVSDIKPTYPLTDKTQHYSITSTRHNP